MTADRENIAGERKPSQERREQIADVAMRILASTGSKRLTAKAIAKEIGITDAAVFRHFPTMEAVADAVVEHMEAILFEGFPPLDGSPLSRLRAFFFDRVNKIHGNPAVSAMLISDRLAQASGPAAADRVSEFKARSQAFVRQCLKEAERDGALVPGVGIEEASLLLMGCILALVHSEKVHLGDAAFGKLATKLWSAYERILVPGASDTTEPNGAKPQPRPAPTKKK